MSASEDNGWRDLPPNGQDIAAARRSLDGCQLNLAACGRGARRIYLGVLAGRLRKRGGQTVDELYGQTGWFNLEYTDQELQGVLSEARRRRVIDNPENQPVNGPVTGNVNLGSGHIPPMPKGALTARNAFDLSKSLYGTYKDVKEPVGEAFKLLELLGFGALAAGLAAWAKANVGLLVGVGVWVVAGVIAFRDPRRT